MLEVWHLLLCGSLVSNNCASGWAVAGGSESVAELQGSCLCAPCWTSGTSALCLSCCQVYEGRLGAMLQDAIIKQGT